MDTLLGFGAYKTVTMLGENKENEEEELTLK